MTALTAPPPLASMAAVDSATAQVVSVVRQHAAQADLDAEFPVAALAALRETRLLGLLVPREHGGYGASVSTMTTVCRRIAREDISAALIFAMHCQQVATIVRYGTAELNQTLLRRIADGDVYLASVTTEPGSSGRLLTSDAVPRREGDTLHISREAPIVTGATHADGFLIKTRTPDAQAPTQVSLVYADRAQLELTVTGTWQPMGMRASHSLPVLLTGDVPLYQVVGPLNGFPEMAVTLFGPLAHLGWAACWLGAASGALSRTVTGIRRSGGGQNQRDLSELTLIRLGRTRGRLELVHAALERCLDLVQQPGADLSAPSAQSLLNTLKTEAAEQCFAAVNELIEVAGLRDGYLRDSPLWLERVFRDLRAAALNYSNDRLHLANGRLALLDTEVRLV